MAPSTLEIDTAEGALHARGVFEGPDRVVLDSDDPAWHGRANLVRAL